MKKVIFKIGTEYITTPNAIGKLVRETPSMWVIKITKRTFEPKSSMTSTYKFTKTDKEYMKDAAVGKEKKFWKDSGKEVGGSWFIVSNS